MKFIKTQTGMLVNLDHYANIYAKESFDISGLRLEPTKWEVYAMGDNHDVLLGRYDSIERADEVISNLFGHISRMPEE